MPAHRHPVPLAATAWETVDDDVMGGVSASRVLALAGGGLRFAGRVSLDHGGGFASARVACSLPLGAQATAVSASVRGDGKRYRLTAFVRAPGAAGRAAYHYQCAFDTAGGEQQLELSLATFVARYRGRAVDAPRLAAADIVAVGLQIADRQAGDFALDVLALALVTPQ